MSQTVQWHLIPNVRRHSRVNVCTSFSVTDSVWHPICQVSSTQEKERRHYHARGNCVNPQWDFFPTHISSSNMLVMRCHVAVSVYMWWWDDDREMMRTPMMIMPNRERKGLTLGTQSICAVLSGLTVPFTHPASMSGCRGVAFPAPQLLALAAAHGPFAPLVPASINCSLRICANVDIRRLADTQHVSAHTHTQKKDKAAMLNYFCL